MIRDHAPDVVGVTAITPSIYSAEEVLKIAREVAPKAVRVMGGVHATFMYKQVLSEAPWIDVIVRGEGEEICTELMLAIEDGRWPADRHKIKGLAFMRRRRDRRDACRLHRQGPGRDQAGLVRAGMGEIHLHPAGHAGGDPEPGARLPVHLFVLQPVEILARLPRARPQGRGRRDRGSGGQSWRWLLHPRRRGTHHQPEEIHRVLRGTDRPRPAGPGEVGHQHPRDRHLPRQGSAEVLPQGRAGPCQPWHRGGGADEAGSCSTRKPRSTRTRRRSACLREADILVEAQFIVGLDNETPETLEETYQMAWDWQPDLANWSMYTPWPFTPLFQELKDKVEVFDFQPLQLSSPRS